MANNKSLMSVDPDKVKYLTNNDDKFLTYGSNKTIICQCPYCGVKAPSTPKLLHHNGMSCFCKKGISYPNRFMYSLLSYYNIEFQREYHPKWSGNKFYDFYIPSKRIIIEMHGKQHYSNEFGRISGSARTLTDEQNNDKYKKEIAKKNGIYKYFIINSSISNFDYIKDNVIQSRLLDLLDINITQVDWDNIEKLSEYGFLRKVCEDYSSKGIDYVYRKYKFRKGLTQKYLLYGTKLGFCDYDGISGHYDKVYQFQKDGKLLHTYDSLTQAATITGISIYHISGCIHKYYGRKSAGGYIWSFSNNIKIDEYYNNQGNNRKTILQYDISGNFIKQYNSILEASKDNGISDSTIRDMLKGKQKTAGGFVWKYKIDNKTQ